MALTVALDCCLTRAVGRDFDIQAVHAIDARTRGFLYRAIAASSGGGRADARRTGNASLWFSGKEHTMKAMTLSPTLTTESGDKADSKPKMSKNRVQFDLAPRSMDRLNGLKLKTEAASYAEVVKNALRLYEALIEETESGKQFFVQDQNGTLSPYRLFL